MIQASGLHLGKLRIQYIKLYGSMFAIQDRNLDLGFELSASQGGKETFNWFLV